MITWILRRMPRKQRIATYLAALPPNGKRDDEIGELVHTAYQGKRHVHGNPIKKEKADGQADIS